MLSLFSGDEILEWNGHSLVNRSYEDVQNVISESRHDTQVELHVSRVVVPGSAAAAGGSLPGGGGLGPGGTRPGLNRQQQLPSRASSRPAVTISDPLGDTLMLNPNVTPNSNSTTAAAAAASLGTRIQVGAESCRSLFISKNYY